MSCPFNVRRVLTGLRRRLYWFLHFSAHTTSPLEWHRDTASWEHNLLCNMCHQQTGLSGPLRCARDYLQIVQVRRLYEFLCYPRLYVQVRWHSFSTESLNVLSERSELRSLIKLAETCNWYNLYNNPGCHVVSKAFSISENTENTIDLWMFKFKVTGSMILMHWRVMLWRARKSSWFEFRKLFSSTRLWTAFRITCPNGLPVVDRR